MHKDKILTVAALAIAVVSFSSGASATNINWPQNLVGGFSGHPTVGSTLSQFGENWNGVVNNGSAAAGWAIDLPLIQYPDATVKPHLWVFASSSSSGVNCTVQSVDGNQNTISNSGWFTPSTTGWTDYQLPTVNVLSTGTVQVICGLTQNSHIQTVAW